jgi:hypothetical protein
MCEYNAACIAQMRAGYIKSNLTKHMAPKLFYPHQLQKVREIEILQTKSCDNLADLFTKIIANILVPKIRFWDWYETTQRFARIRGRLSLI